MKWLLTIIYLILTVRASAESRFISKIRVNCNARLRLNDRNCRSRRCFLRMTRRKCWLWRNNRGWRDFCISRRRCTRRLWKVLWGMILLIYWLVFWITPSKRWYSKKLYLIVRDFNLLYYSTNIELELELIEETGRNDENSWTNQEVNQGRENVAYLQA